MYIGFQNWWVSFRHPVDIWQNHPSYLLLEIFTIFTALLTLRHGEPPSRTLSLHLIVPTHPGGRLMTNDGK